jgi:thiol-disulfide isomerase/thioredoxin
VEALVWVLHNTSPENQPQKRTELAPLRLRALEMLERDHFQKPELAGVCQKLGESPAPDCEALLRAAKEKHAQPDVQALAAFALANSLAKQIELAQKRGADTTELFVKAEQQLEEVIKQHAAVPSGRSTLGEVAKNKLYELRFLSIGRQAPEIEGEDLSGVKFKLSDYRGKVVVLDFWADWCGYCRQMYPYERGLVERLKNKPFVLLGVNCDDDKAQAQRAVEKDGLNWRSWWNSSRPHSRISVQWQIDGFPRVYVLDDKGIIRHLFSGHSEHIEKEMDEAIDKLLAEMAASDANKQ